MKTKYKPIKIDGLDIDDKHTIKLGGYSYVEYKPKWNWLHKLTPFVNKYFNPVAIHKPAEVVFFKENAIYKLEALTK